MSSPLPLPLAPHDMSRFETMLLWTHHPSALLYDPSPKLQPASMLGGLLRHLHDQVPRLSSKFL